MLVLSGCDTLLFSQGTPTALATTAPSETVQTTQRPPTPGATRTPPQPTTLQVWVPPRFDPESDSSAGRLLRARLAEFTARRTGVHVEVRVKSATGPGGLLDSLNTASAAAPLALPDLILLQRGLLETAALKGLLYPFDGLSSALDQQDWYDYARDLARLQESTFGLPFAADGLILMYRPADVAKPPTDWTETLELKTPLAFPAADELALFTLSQYMANGAPLEDAQGRPSLDPGSLTELLAFLGDAASAGVMPFWLTQYSSFDQSWEAYTENRADLVIDWASRYMAELPGDTDATLIPTPDGRPFTLVDGWVWALANPQVQRHAASAELAEFLTDPDFLAKWTAAAGYLPPRASALAGWSNTPLRSLVEDIARTAHSMPPTEVMNVVGLPLEEATVDVLKEQSAPADAAEKAAQKIRSP